MEALKYWEQGQGLCLSSNQIPTVFNHKELNTVTPFTQREQNDRFVSKDEYYAWNYTTASQRRAASLGYGFNELGLSTRTINPRNDPATYSNLNTSIQVHPNSIDQFEIQHMNDLEANRRPDSQHFIQTHHQLVHGELVPHAHHSANLFVPDRANIYAERLKEVYELIKQSGHTDAYLSGFQ